MIHLIACADFAALTNFGFAVAGALIGGLAAHYLTKDRDVAARRAIAAREADIRRRGFQKFILRCGYTLERTNGGQSRLVWECYAAMAPDILAEAALVEGDVHDPEALRSAVRRAGEWRYADAETEAEHQGCQLRDVLCDSIRAIQPHIRE